MMKRTLLSFILAIGMTANIWADTVIEGIKYALNDDFTATVTGLDDPSFTGTVTIPETIKYYGNTYQVVQIGDKAFFEYKFKSVVILNSVTSIGDSAFYDCIGLTSVNIPNSVTTIGNYAFYNCKGLTSVTIGNSVTSIGEWAFYNCKGLTSVNIPNSVTSIGNGTFQSCNGLTSVTIPNSVTSIGQRAFSECTGLTAINVNENNTIYSSIDGVLFNKSQTELIKYPEGKQGAYTIPNSVTSIGEWAFSGCRSLTSVTIPNSVTSIEKCAFWECTGLTSVTIPNSVASIGEWAFSGCRSLTSVTIPNSVASIGSDAFRGCSGLTSITIPNSVTSIGSDAFRGCSGLTSITIPNSVTSIGNYAFYNCSGLKDIYCHIEEPLMITTDVFRNVRKNTCTLHVPIGSKERYEVKSVWKDFLNIVEDLPALSFTIGNLKYTIISDSTVKVSKNGTITGGVVIPESVEYEGKQYSVTSIVDRAFENCTGLTSVTIGNSVTSIGIGAFSGCSGLTEINVDENNTAYSSIDGVLFNKSQTELVCYPGGKQGAYTIPNSVTSIGNYAFYNCSGLTSVTIPNSVTNIGYFAFRDCTGLTSVTIPNSVTSLGNGVFAFCTGLTSVAISNSVTSIKNATFYECTSLISINIPNSVTTIVNSAFYRCTSLTSVTIPNSVTSIERSAFRYCAGLTEIYCHIDDPITIDSYVFGDVPTNTCTLHVPIGSKEKYEVADVWKEFNIVEDLPTGIVSIAHSQLTIDNDVWFTLNGVRLNGKPTIPGIYIVNGKRVVIK